MTKQFWYSALIRAIRTIAQTAVAMISTAVVMSDVNWQMVASASLLAGILSVLTSIATGLPEVDGTVNDWDDDPVEYETDEEEDEDELTESDYSNYIL